MALPDLNANSEWCDVNRELGRGTFGVVRLVTLRATGEFMAVKCFNKFVPRREALKEAAILSSLNHPNVVHHHGFAGGDAGVHLVMEYCVLGSLQSHNKAWGYSMPMDLAGHLQLTHHNYSM